jgi:hypothetical protein
MGKSNQRATENTVGGNLVQRSIAENAEQTAESNKIAGNLTQETLNAKKGDIEDVLKEVLAAVENLGLKKEEKADLKAHTKTAKAQMKAKSPEPTVISACLRGISKPLKRVATSAAVSGAAKLATMLLDKIGAFLQ